LVQQGFEVQVGVFADQLEIESVGLTDGLAAAESEHLQVMLETFDGQREMGLVGGGEHACSSWINPLIGAWRGEGCRCTTETPLWNAGSAHSRAAKPVSGDCFAKTTSARRARPKSLITQPAI